MQCPNVDALLATMTALQYEEWKAYYEVDPWGEERADLRIGLLACAVERLLGGSKLRPDLFLIPQPNKPEQSQEDMAATMRQIATAHNAALAAKGKA